MTDQPRSIELKIHGDAGNAVRRLELILFQVLTSATPVDTGFARASLTPATGSAVAGQLKLPSNKEQAKKEAASRFSENKARSLAIAGTYNLSQGRVFLSYRADYVFWLNQGSSAQAPKKFVERGIAVAVRAV